MLKMKKRTRGKISKTKNIRPELKTIDSISISDVAKILGMSARWVDSQCRNRNLKASKWGHFWRISPQHLIEFLQESANHDNEELSKDHVAVIEMLTERIGKSTLDTFR